jgi:mannose-1-phosphate guanylyltransferase
MFEHATDRLAPLFSPERIFVIARQALNEKLSALVPSIPATNFVSEPVGRGTAPAIALAALHLQWQDPDATMAILTADHFVADTARFRQSLVSAAQLAQAGHLVTLGIKPTSPSTGYGYIKHAEPLPAVNEQEVFGVAQFTEKPDLKTATQMVASKAYSWNSGMFIWRVDRILAEFERQMPTLYAQLDEISTALGTPEYETSLARVWPQVEKQTIDYGVMEGATDVVVIPVDLGWSDVGSWSSMFQVLQADGNGNVVVADHVGIDTYDTLVMGGKRLIATIGLQDLIIVDTDDALLVCSREREQDVREIVQKLKNAGRKGLV